MPHVTLSLVRIAGALRASPGLSGYEISKRLSIWSGTLYPALFRMEEAGWATSEWELGDPRELGRPRRRFYSLTPEGDALLVV